MARQRTGRARRVSNSLTSFLQDEESSILLCDVDGTLPIAGKDLLSYPALTGQLPRVLQQNNHFFGLSSGRSFRLMPRFLHPPDIVMAVHEAFAKYRPPGQKEFIDLDTGLVPSLTAENIIEVRDRFLKLGIRIKVAVDIGTTLLAEEGMDWPYGGREGKEWLSFEELLENLPDPTIKVYVGLDNSDTERWSGGPGLSRSLVNSYYSDINHDVADGKLDEEQLGSQLLAAGRIPELLPMGLGKGRLTPRMRSLFGVASTGMAGDTPADVRAMALADYAFVTRTSDGRQEIPPQAIEILLNPALLSREENPEIRRMFLGVKEFEPTRIKFVSHPETQNLFRAVSRALGSNARSARPLGIGEEKLRSRPYVPGPGFTGHSKAKGIGRSR